VLGIVKCQMKCIRTHPRLWNVHEIERGITIGLNDFERYKWREASQGMLIFDLVLRSLVGVVMSSKVASKK